MPGNLLKNVLLSRDMSGSSPQKRKHVPIHGEEKIVVKGARTHNLKNITVEMPRNTMIAVTGLSGSGKSSFAFDTIFAEGQRRYIESLSPYARQFLGQMEKPDVDEITGLSPAIAMSTRSTAVSTLLFAVGCSTGRVARANHIIPIIMITRIIPNIFFISKFKLRLIQVLYHIL
jgi:hypothetical protein